MIPPWWKKTVRCPYFMLIISVCKLLTSSEKSKQILAFLLFSADFFAYKKLMIARLKRKGVRNTDPTEMLIIKCFLKKAVQQAQLPLQTQQDRKIRSHWTNTFHKVNAATVGGSSQSAVLLCPLSCEELWCSFWTDRFKMIHTHIVTWGLQQEANSPWIALPGAYGRSPPPRSPPGCRSEKTASASVLYLWPG